MKRVTAVFFLLAFLVGAGIALPAEETESSTSAVVPPDIETDDLLGGAHPEKPVQPGAPAALSLTGDAKPRSGAHERPGNPKPADQGVTTGAGPERTPAQNPPKWLEDRPWIIHPYGSAEAGKNGPKKIEFKWNDRTHEGLCRDYLNRAGTNLGKARYYSVHGDTCRTAEYAARFLKTVSECRRDCPPGFLEANGYNDEIVRNLKILRELGAKRCLGPQ